MQVRAYEKAVAETKRKHFLKNTTHYFGEFIEEAKKTFTKEQQKKVADLETSYQECIKEMGSSVNINFDRFILLVYGCK